MEKGDLILQELAKINSRLDCINSKLDRIEETTETTQASITKLLVLARNISNALQLPPLGFNR